MNPDQPKPTGELVARITDYLGAGGLFNPEMMEHDKVRDLLMDCRDALTQPKPATELRTLAAHRKLAQVEPKPATGEWTVEMFDHRLPSDLVTKICQEHNAALAKSFQNGVDSKRTGIAKGEADQQPKPTDEWTAQYIIQFIGLHSKYTEAASFLADAINAALSAERENLIIVSRTIGELRQQLAAEREKVEQLRESHACLFTENERLRERGWPDYPTDLQYQQLKEQLAAEREMLQTLADALKRCVKRITPSFEPESAYAQAHNALAKVKEGN